MKKWLSLALLLIVASSVFGEDLWEITSGKATIDGVISTGEWDHANWHNLDVTIYRDTSDLSNVQYASMWNKAENLLYVVVKATDTTRYLFDSYQTGWKDHDVAEIYTDFTNSNDEDLSSTKLDLAQQWIVSKGATGDGEWATLRSGIPIPDGLEPEYQVSLNGDNFIYELAFTPRDYLDIETPENSTTMQLELDHVLGFDVNVGTKNNSVDGFGVLANNTLTGRSSDAAKFQDHTLVGRAGDADLNGQVDADDLATWGANYTGDAGSGKDWGTGDFDGDGDVDADDLSTWGANYTGVIGGGSMTAVPEPATMSLIGLGAVALVRRRRK